MVSFYPAVKNSIMRWNFKQNNFNPATILTENLLAVCAVLYVTSINKISGKLWYFRIVLYEIQGTLIAQCIFHTACREFQSFPCVLASLFFRMAGDSGVDESQLKGLSKYFNSQTNKGRANVSTYYPIIATVWIIIVQSNYINVKNNEFYLPIG